MGNFPTAVLDIAFDESASKGSKAVIQPDCLKSTIKIQVTPLSTNMVELSNVSSPKEISTPKSCRKALLLEIGVDKAPKKSSEKKQICKTCNNFKNRNLFGDMGTSDNEIYEVKLPDSPLPDMEFHTPMKTPWMLSKNVTTDYSATPLRSSWYD